MLRRLDSFFEAQLPDASPRVSTLQITSSGRSRQNWSFDLEWSENGRQRTEPLILRRDPAGGLVETDRTREFEVLRALEGSDVPAPAARWLDADGTWFGKPSLIMRREQGVCDYYVLTGSRPLPERLGLARAFCDLLAQVHSVDWDAAGLASVLADPGPDAGACLLEEWEAVLQRDQLEAYPELTLSAQWLRATAPLSRRTVLVHGDFKPGNILLDADKIVALLDWELAHLGDPCEDLGWITQPLRQREHFIPGEWDRPRILEHYQNRTGEEVDQAAVTWWGLFATFRTAVMQVSGLRSFLEDRSDESYRPTASVLRTLVEAVDRS